MAKTESNQNLQHALEAIAVVDLEQEEGLPEWSKEEFAPYFTERFTDPRQQLVTQLKLSCAPSQTGYRIPIYAINSGFFIDTLFQSLTNQLATNSRVLTGLLGTKISLMNTLLLDPRFIAADQHFFRVAIRQFLNLLCGWYDPLLEDHNEYWIQVEKCIDCLCQISGRELGCPDVLQQELNHLSDFNQQMSEASAALRRQELKRHEQNSDQRDVDDFFDRILAHKPFPILIARFLKETWRNVLLRQKSDRNLSIHAWQKICQFTEDFCEIFCMDKKPKSDILIATIRPNLTKYIIGNEKDKQFLITEIIKTLSKIQKGEELKSVEIQPILERNRLKNINFSSSVIKSVSALPVGQWIEFKGGEFNGKILQLSDKLTQSQEVLLINAAGDFATFMSLQGLAYLTISKQAYFLPSENVFDRAFAEASITFLEHFSHCEDLKLARERDHIKALKQELKNATDTVDKFKKQLLTLQNNFDKAINAKTREIATLTNILSDAQAKMRDQEADIIRLKQQQTDMEIQYLQQIEALQTSQSRVENENQMVLAKLLEEKENLANQLQQKNQENRRHEIVQQVKSLNIGSWLEILSDQHQYTPCKIAMIYSSSGKYVLVDGKGLALGEYVAEDLIELFFQGNARIVQQAGKFDDSMESIIKSLK